MDMYIYNYDYKAEPIINIIQTQSLRITFLEIYELFVTFLK